MSQIEDKDNVLKTVDSLRITVQPRGAERAETLMDRGDLILREGDRIRVELSQKGERRFMYLVGYAADNGDGKILHPPEGQGERALRPDDELEVPPLERPTWLLFLILSPESALAELLKWEPLPPILPKDVPGARENSLRVVLLPALPPGGNWINKLQ